MTKYTASFLRRRKQNIELKPDPILDVKQVSKEGYEFDPKDIEWKLDKNSSVYLAGLEDTLNFEYYNTFRKVLVWYAVNRSGNYTYNMVLSFMRYFRSEKTGWVSYTGIINYRSKLTRKDEQYLAIVRTLLKKWKNMGYDGVSNEVMDLLNGFRLKAPVSGKRVQLLDPEHGPFSDLELEAIHERTYQAFDSGRFDTKIVAGILLLSHIGCRPIQLTHLKIKDIIQNTNSTLDGQPKYFVNMPSAKQRAPRRTYFHLYSITEDLWDFVNSHAQSVATQFKRMFPEINEDQVLELPFYPDWRAVEKWSTRELVDSLDTDLPHISRSRLSENLLEALRSLKIISERTGEKLCMYSYRFRYTVGTNLVREGFGEQVVAEALDHSDTQHAKDYTKNIPEFIRHLDEAIGRELMPIAQAFAGTLIDQESDAINGGKRSKRIRINFDEDNTWNVGTCGENGFCTDYAPIACYTCAVFQPWLEAPHQIVLNWLFKERDRVYEITGDERVSSTQDRTIHAVLDVIKRCAIRKNELDAQKKITTEVVDV